MIDHAGDLAARIRVPAPGRGWLRVLLVVNGIVALLLSGSALDPGNGARAADGQMKAVVIVGPVHDRTSRYLAYGRAMADAAEAQGMEVIRIFHPNATPSRVIEHANGANLLIYAGHGNGWPSQFPPFQERTKNGLGLNPTNGERTTYNVKYMGADWLRENIHLAPNAIVILSHLSYASGNASSGMPIPSQKVAVERVDNFAAGFIASGARVVWALGWQPGEDIIDALHEEQASMDAVFMTRYRQGANPLNGWIGWRPALYFDSLRTPGAEIHIDPHRDYGYLRAVTGDLAMTTDEWRSGSGGGPPDDTEAPVLSDVTVKQEAVTVATAEDSAPVFTPNGDGVSDTITVKHTLSEPAFLDVKVERVSNDAVVRRLTGWSRAGRRATIWDGRRDSREMVGDGTYRIVITPKDRSGNVGEAVSIKVKVLAALKAPSVAPALFYPNDDDELAQTTRFKARLAKAGTISLLVLTPSGQVVRTGIDGVDYEPGRVTWEWDGRDDAGARLPTGIYRGRVRVTRSGGSYGHDVSVQLLPFSLEPSDRTLRRGQKVTLSVTAAEPMSGKPTITARQPGKPEVQLKVRRQSATSFTARFEAASGGRDGVIRVKVEGTDEAGGTQVHRFRELTLH